MDTLLITMAVFLSAPSTIMAALWLFGASLGVLVVCGGLLYSTLKFIAQTEASHLQHQQMLAQQHQHQLRQQLEQQQLQQQQEPGAPPLAPPLPLPLVPVAVQLPKGAARRAFIAKMHVIMGGKGLHWVWPKWGPPDGMFHGPKQKRQ